MHNTVCRKNIFTPHLILSTLTVCFVFLNAIFAEDYKEPMSKEEKTNSSNYIENTINEAQKTSGVFDELNKQLLPTESISISTDASVSQSQTANISSQALKRNDTQRFSIYAVVILLLCGIILSPEIINYLTISSQGYKDYRLCRGTQHLKQIRASLKILKQKIKDLVSQKNHLEKSIEENITLKVSKLRKALVTHLVETELDSVDGIGSKLKSAIIRTCFDGTLQSLHRVQGRVYGIGDSKQWALLQWAKGIELRLPGLLVNDFPGREKINEEHAKKDNELKNELEKINKELGSLSDLKNIATSVEERLGKIRPRHFTSAYKDNKESSAFVNEYIKGAFPEWAPMPNWFKTLISEYGA